MVNHRYLRLLSSILINSLILVTAVTSVGYIFFFLIQMDSKARVVHLEQEDYSKFQKVSSHFYEPQKVLIISYYRSGTSWFGKLISSHPNAFYVYEPLYADQIADHNREFVNSYKEFRLQQLLHCQFSSPLLHYSRRFKLRENCKKVSNCTAQELSETCNTASTLVIKTTRFLLSETEDLLIKPTLKNLKVIFLVRDPRGSMNSLSNMEKIMRQRVNEVCIVLRENLQYFPYLKRIEPDRLLLLRYEDLALYPFETSERIWNFIEDSETPMPQEWRQYLLSSQTRNSTSRIGSYQINRKSVSDWEAWRSVISEELLSTSEQKCEDVLQILGFRKFGDISSARNLSLELLLSENCTDIPCKS